MRAMIVITLLVLLSSPLRVGAQDGEVLAADMLRAATSGNESKVLELKSRIDLLPKPARGDRKAARILNEIALKQLSENQFSDASETLAHATAADPSDVEILNNLGIAFLKMKKFDDAVRVLTLALAISPGRSGAWFNLGQAFAEQGNAHNSVAAMDLAQTFSQNKDKTREFLQNLAAESSTSPAIAAAATESLSHGGVPGIAPSSAQRPAVLDEKSTAAVPSEVPSEPATPIALPASTETVAGITNPYVPSVGDVQSQAIQTAEALRKGEGPAAPRLAPPRSSEDGLLQALGVLGAIVAFPLAWIFTYRNYRVLFQSYFQKLDSPYEQFKTRVGFATGAAFSTALAIWFLVAVLAKSFAQRMGG